MWLGGVGLFRGVVVEGLVGSDGVVDDAEGVDFHVEGVAVADVAAVEVFVFEGADEALDDTAGLGSFDPGAHMA